MNSELNPETIRILEMSMSLALWTFWCVFAVIFLPTLLSWTVSKKRYHLLRASWRALLVALMVSSLSSLVYALAPLPFLENFSTGDAWKKVPIRITLLDSNRLQEGFTITGEIWNQQDVPISNIQVVITILDHNKELLDKVFLETKPGLVESGDMAHFQLNYHKKPTLIYGYQISFLDANNTPMQHVSGFNTE